MNPNQGPPEIFFFSSDSLWLTWMQEAARKAGMSLATGAEANHTAKIAAIPAGFDPANPTGVRKQLEEVFLKGLAVVTTPLARQFDFIKPGWNCLIAEDRESWSKLFSLLKNDPDLCVRIAENARHSVARTWRPKSPTIAFYLGPGLEQWDETHLEKGIGGSETAAISLGRELSLLGYQVKIFADPAREHYDFLDYDVEYRSWKSWLPYSRSKVLDCLVSSRTIDPIRFEVQANKKFVWFHDLIIPDLGFDEDFSDEVDGFVCLSDWHREYVSKYHGISKQKISVIPNGVDPKRYENRVLNRNPAQIIYSSSPDRGLDTLLSCVPQIHQFVPKLTVKIAYGFENWIRLATLARDEQALTKIKEIKASLAQPAVTYLGRIGQQELARVQVESALWAYPTRFEETSCITAMEAGCAGAAILTSHLAGLIDTVSDEGGILLRGDAYTREYREQFIESAVRLLTDSSHREEWSENARKRMNRFRWSSVAANWDLLCKSRNLEVQA